MAVYCGTNDCAMICAGWGSMAGTSADAIIAEASAMLDALLNDFSISPPPPLTAGGTAYDYYLRRATALLANWLAAESLYRYEHEPGADTWWSGYRAEAEGIIADIREGKRTLTPAVSQWERGIGPAVPTVHGTIAAPPLGGCISNSDIVGEYYTDDAYPRTAVIELDGTGTNIWTQTWRWGWYGGTGWEDESIPPSPGTWHDLGYGLRITFDPARTGDALVAGQRWTVACNPSRARGYKGPGLRSFVRKRG